MTRDQKLSAFAQLEKLPNVKRGTVYADELANTARLKFDHPYTGNWHVDGPTDIPGFYHLSATTPLVYNVDECRADYTRFTLVLPDNDFERVK
jgi:hypothetical protein